MKTPNEYIDELESLTHQFSKLSEAWADLITYQAEHYKDNRHLHKSDTAVQRAFDRTEKGIEMQIVKAKLKSKGQQMTTIRAALRLLDTQARNLN
jgi:hypothetical protein